MSMYKGKLHETAEKFSDTDIWIDSCGEEELDYALERGAVGATSNPLIVGAVIKNELPRWEPTIKDLIADMADATEEEIAWKLIDRVGAERAKWLMPVYQKFNGKKGRLSIQTNAKYYRSKEKMVEQAMELNGLGENMQVKMPASKAGIQAMEEATTQGVSINATVSFTVAQAVAVAEAVERGLKRREKEGLPIDQMAPICTIMIGRTDDWVKKSVAQSQMVVNPECMEWAGVAVMKEAYRIYMERGYRTKLLCAAYRNHHHWSQFIGGNIAMTIPFNWHKMLNACDISVESRINRPVPDEYLNELKKIPEFIKSFDENGMSADDFVQYGGFRDTLSSFIAGYENLLQMIRGYMI